MALREWIERPQRVWLRRALFQVHLWTGVGLGLYILVVSVTGAALVFRWELEAWAAPSPRSENAQPLSFEALRKSAEQAHPGYRVVGFLKPKDSHSAVPAWLEKDGQTISRLLDPGAGGDLGEPKLESALEWIADLHINLLSGEVGFIVNGAGAGCLLLMTLTGAAIWWPGRKNWRRSLTVKWGAKWKRLNWDLHSAVGFWTIIFLLIWGLTGVYFVFPDPFLQAFNLITPTEPPRDGPPEPALIPGREFRPLDELIAAAESATPGAFTTWITPAHESAWAQIIRHERYEPWSGHCPRVYVNAYTGEVEHQDIDLKGNPGDAIQRWISYLHFGTFGGTSVKLLWFAVGLAPATLAVTGALMWWNRVLSKYWSTVRSYAK